MRVPRVVFRDSRLDLADEVSSGVAAIVDPAAEAGEDRDQRAAECQADEVLRGLFLGLVSVVNTP